MQFISRSGFKNCFVESITNFNNCTMNFDILLDIPDINFVVNYDYPNSAEDYIHRIGRTARAERTGTAYTFFTEVNGKYAADLVQVMEEAGQTVPPKLAELGGKSYSGKKRSTGFAVVVIEGINSWWKIWCQCSYSKYRPNDSLTLKKVLGSIWNHEIFSLSVY